nr:ArdC family protein [Exiguobacterium sp. NG55]
MKTNEERKAELEALTEQMGQQIDSYFESPEKIREHLQFLGKFHQYSMRNAVLIESQFPGAIAVGSYPFWEKQGAQVQKGERGIKVFVPNPVTYALHKDEWVPLSKAPKPIKDGVKQGRIPSRKMMYFKIGHVFEYTQTDARGCPECDAIGGTARRDRDGEGVLLSGATCDCLEPTEHIDRGHHHPDPRARSL